jgi:hypothetical protein
MTRSVLACLLFGAMAWGQASPASTPATQSSNAPVAAAAPTPGEAAEAAKVAPDAAVVTINGVCDNPPADGTTDSNCKTVVTRAEFERLLDAIQPNMPPRVRRQFAMRYATALAAAAKAHTMGLDQGQKYDDRLRLARLQILSTSLNQAIQEKAGQVSDAEIEDYYKNNLASYEEADLQRIFVPRTQQEPKPKAGTAADKSEAKATDAAPKLSPAEEKQREKEGAAAMKAEANKLHARAVAGESFTKLQLEGFQVGGLKTKPPSVKLGKEQRTGLPPSQASVMDLKSGEVSPVIEDQNGYYVYKMGEKDTIPLDKVKDDIRATLRTQRIQAEMQKLQQAATPTLNDSYFGEEGGPMRGMPMVPPTAAPGSKPSGPGPK